MTTNTPTPAPDLDVRVAALMALADTYYTTNTLSGFDFKQAIRAELQKPALHDPCTQHEAGEALGIFASEDDSALEGMRNAINFVLQGRAKPATANPDDVYAEDKAVDSFAERMKWKLAKARERGKYGWQDKNWTPEEISQALREHVAKGDPVDVANYCMFLAARNEPITEPAQEEITDAEILLPKPDCPNIWGGCYSEKLVREIIRASKGEKT